MAPTRAGELMRVASGSYVPAVYVWNSEALTGAQSNLQPAVTFAEPGCALREQDGSVLRIARTKIDLSVDDADGPVADVLVTPAIEQHAPGKMIYMKPGRK